jgi:hypothetical protein
MCVRLKSAGLAALLFAGPAWADDGVPPPPMPTAAAGAILTTHAPASAEDVRQLAGRVEQLAAAIERMPARSSAWNAAGGSSAIPADARDPFADRLASLERGQSLLSSSLLAQGISLTPSAPSSAVATPQAAMAAPQAAMLGGSLVNLFTTTDVKTRQPGLFRTWLANFGTRLSGLSAPTIVVTYSAPTATVSVSPPVAPIIAAPTPQAAAIMQPSTAPFPVGAHLFSRWR